MPHTSSLLARRLSINSGRGLGRRQHRSDVVVVVVVVIVVVGRRHRSDLLVRVRIIAMMMVWWHRWSNIIFRVVVDGDDRHGTNVVAIFVVVAVVSWPGRRCVSAGFSFRHGVRCGG